MPYRVEFLRVADREFDRLAQAVRKRLAPHIRALADDPRPMAPGALSPLMMTFTVFGSATIALCTVSTTRPASSR